MSTAPPCFLNRFPPSLHLAARARARTQVAPSLGQIAEMSLKKAHPPAQVRPEEPGPSPTVKSLLIHIFCAVNLQALFECREILQFR